MSRSSRALALVQTPFEATAARTRRSVPLGDLDVAPENLRAGEPPDDDIPLLADALLAAGQLQPITVRPGRRQERAYMALDGRRRLLALRRLAGEGRIDDGFAVDVVIETQAARQAAAAVLTNTALPVHPADVIAAIGRMLRSKLGAPEIARALGQAEIDVKRLAALSALPDVALDALRAGRINLRQARLLARLNDPDEQAELARDALEGRGFPDWRLTEKLDRAYVQSSDPRCGLVCPERYTAAGGRIESDLFGERAPVLLDPSILTDVWMARARQIAAPFEAEGLTIHVTAGDPPDLPDELEAAGCVYGGMLPAAERAAYRAARDAHEAAAGTVQVRLAGTTEPEDVDPEIAAMIQAGLVRDQIALGGRVVTTLVISPARRTGVQVQAYAPVEPAVAADPAEDPDTDRSPEEEAGAERPAPFAPPLAVAPAPEVEGVGHALHGLRTEVATQGLIRALADDPPTAFTALIARLFLTVTSRGRHARAESALALSADVFSPGGGRVIPSLDGVVRQRLDDRRAVWEGSGLTLIRWIHGLPEAGRMALLADLIALTLDLREARTSLIRGSARAEAAELAELCGAQIAQHWTPDTAFLSAHSKPLLLGMLEAMGQADARAGALGKAELVALVEATAQARRWAPPGLSWCREAGGPPDEAATEHDGDDEGSDEDAAAPDDGVGAFEVTAEGEAALARAAG